MLLLLSFPTQTGASYKLLHVPMQTHMGSLLFDLRRI